MIIMVTINTINLCLIEASMIFLSMSQSSQYQVVARDSSANKGFVINIFKHEQASQYQVVARDSSANKGFAINIFKHDQILLVLMTATKAH
ncbi:protein of unknown function [Shewanella benthica]|uniref:Uncharacterized protein n=1 Tax=Shewanella benthica TaxID=43661 RepID=A0A330LYV8_9GAMM|nr:protein of unknown function [Shewanella benthica]